MFSEMSIKVLGLTYLISMLHVVFDFLAFKNDISFYKNIKSMKDLDIFTTRPQVEDDEKVTERLSKTVDSYMDRLSTSVKLTEHRKVLKGSS